MVQLNQNTFAIDKETAEAVDKFLTRLRYDASDGVSNAAELLERHWELYQAYKYGTRVSPREIEYNGKRYAIDPNPHHAYFAAENFTDDRKE